MSTRLEFCLKELDKSKKNKNLHHVFQELNNMLPTYKEKKALQQKYLEMTGRKE